MLARISLFLVALLYLFTAVGCEGETGPAGPAGPAGPQGQDGAPGASVIQAFGSIQGVANPPFVIVSWPQDVSVSITDPDFGVYQVTLTGTFPGDRGIVIASSSDTQGDATVSAVISTWTSTEITFVVTTWSTRYDILEDYRFTYVVLAE